MEKSEKQHVTVPSVDLKENGLENIDPYVYACIKRYMNAETKKCFPSLQTLMKDSGLSRVTIIRAIERLEDSGFLEIERNPVNLMFTNSTILRSSRCSLMTSLIKRN